MRTGVTKPAMKKLFQSDWVSRLIDALLPVFATLAALLVGAIMLLFLKVNPIEAYKALWVGAFGSSNAFAETLVKATPLLLVALGICISFRDVINIGGEDQNRRRDPRDLGGSDFHQFARLAGDHVCYAGRIFGWSRLGWNSWVSQSLFPSQ
jgi:hypothetical protein